MVVVGVVVITAYLELGVHTSYGSGIDASLGGQIQRDFLADQAAEVAALSKNDASAIKGRLVGNALRDVTRQIGDQTASKASITVTFQPSSLSILRAQDPADPTLVIEVQEDGTKTTTTRTGANGAPIEQSVPFHGDFWLRKDGSGRYVIGDQNIQSRPASILPAVVLIVVAGAWMAAFALVLLRRRLRPVPQQAAPGVVAAMSEMGSEAPIYKPAEGSTLPPPQVAIHTFGGLQVHLEGKDLAGDLKARPEIAFVWLRLLLEALRHPGARLSWDDLARQTSPGLDREGALARMTDVFGQGFRDLPHAVRDCILVETHDLSFRLDDKQVDAVYLLTVASECAGQNTLSAMQIARAQQAIDSSSGIFLPEFEGLEDAATYRHPTSTDLIRQQREWLTAKRLDLVLVLADTHVAGGRPGEAVSVLESAFQERPDSADLRARLIAAFVAAGRNDDASALELKQGRA